MKALETFKQMPPCTAEALVSYLGELLPQIAGTQERYKVTDVPTLRTLRFYTSQGLLDKPVAYEGRTARYGYRHLLQVVVIKCLQANHLPLRKIREMLQGLSNQDLEGLLDLPARAWREEESASLIWQDGFAPPPGEAPGQAARGSGLALPLLRGILQSRVASPPFRPEQGIMTREPERLLFDDPTARPTSWRRLEVEPGVELHLREDIKVKTGSQLDVLLARIKHLLQQQRKA